MQVSFVLTTVDASGLGEAEMFATRSGDMLRSRSTWSDEARVVIVGANVEVALSVRVARTAVSRRKGDICGAFAVWNPQERLN